MKENPFHSQDLKVIVDKSNLFLNGIILPKNSPLTPIIQHGINRLMENGILDIMLKGSEAEINARGQNVETIQLSVGQMLLGICLAVVAFLFSGIVLFFELLIKKLKLL